MENSDILELRSDTRRDDARSRRPIPAARRPPRVAGRRIFKPDGNYVCAKEGLMINGEVYSSGDRVNPRTLSLARLRTLFDAGFIELAE